MSTGLFPQSIIMGTENGDIQNVQRISISSGDSAPTNLRELRAAPFMQLSWRGCARALTDGPHLLRAVRQVTVSVCKEQSPSAREDGWEPVQQLELGPGRQHESLSLDAEARFIRFHIGAGCATPLPHNSRWRPPPARHRRPLSSATARVGQR